MNTIDPDFKHCALLTIDMQNDFTLPGAVAEIKGTNKIVSKIREALTVCRTNGIPIIHIIRLYLEDGANADLCRKAWLASGVAVVRPGTKGAELVDGIKPPVSFQLDETALLKGRIQPIGQKEWVMYKPRWGAFYQTELEAFLKQMHINTLIFSGCNFPNCPRTSLYEASERDFRLVLLQDAVSCLYKRGLTEMERIGVMVTPTKMLKEIFD